jgi:two-component system, response regulator, stage 0 sporulation protein F
MRDNQSEPRLPRNLFSVPSSFLPRQAEVQQVRFTRSTREFQFMATILVIDDEESIRTLLKDVLEKAGHHVIQASDGREGLTAYQKNKVDLVMMDILMPDTDGLEATLQLTREYLDAKIIAMTGAQGDKNFLDVAKLFGARRVFEKPFDLEKLVQAVNEELTR